MRQLLLAYLCTSSYLADGNGNVPRYIYIKYDGHHLLAYALLCVYTKSHLSHCLYYQSRFENTYHLSDRYQVWLNAQALHDVLLAQAAAFSLDVCICIAIYLRSIHVELTGDGTTLEGPTDSQVNGYLGTYLPRSILNVQEHFCFCKSVHIDT